MAQFDLSSALSAAAAASASNKAGTQKIVVDENQKQALSNEAAGVLTAIGQANNTITAAKQVSDLKIQSSVLEAGALLGTNLQEQNSRMAKLLQEQAATSDAVVQNAQVIKEKQSVGITDDLVGWITNHLTLDADIDQQKALTDYESTLSTQIKDLNANTQTTVQTQKLFDTSMTKASMQAALDKNTLVAQHDAIQQKIQGIAYNIEGVKAAMQGDTTEFSIQREGMNARQSAESMQLQRQAAARAEAEFDFRKEEAALRHQAVADGQDFDNWMIQVRNKGAVDSAGPNAKIVAPGSADAKRILTLIKSGSPLGAQEVAYIQAGKTALEKDPTGNSRFVTNSPYILDRRLTSGENIVLNPAQLPIRSLLNQANTDLRQATMVDPTTKVAQVDKKNPQQIQSFVDNRVQQLYDAQAAKVIPGDPKNLQNIALDSKQLLSIPSVANKPFVQKFLKPYLQGGASAGDPSKLFSAVGDAVMRGELSINEAAQMSDVVRKAVQVNIATRNLDAFGITPSYSYNIEVPIGPYKSKVVDLTNPTQLGSALNKYIVSNKFEKSALEISDSVKLLGKMTGL